MVQQTVIGPRPTTGVTGTAQLMTAANVLVQSVNAPAQDGTGLCTCVFTDVAAGTYRWQYKDSFGVVRNRGDWVTILLVTGTYYVYVIPDPATAENQEEIIELVNSIGSNQLSAITVESGVISNFPATLTIGDSYTENTGQIKVLVTDADGDPITEFGTLQLADADISFTAFRPNDSAIITGTCEFVDDSPTETYVLITIPSSQTALGEAEYTYEGRLKFFWEGVSSGQADDEQKTYKTTPFKFVSNP
jgi:hypothetical protein